MKKCDICGGQIVEGSNFCGYCGVDFKDVEEETPVKEQVNVEKIFEASEEKKTNKELPRFTACQLKGIPIFYGLIGYIML
ncbi:MAG: hypothetical protein QCI00_07915, partial [Candidatus Thermoplasmatota archaeon]|nr:hypothetical protein [Candidatus Thermoplasmatota archaeon]